MNENIVMLITGIGTIFWFKGMYRILDYVVPDTINYSVLLVIMGLIILFITDGKIVNSLTPPDNKKMEKLEM